MDRGTGAGERSALGADRVRSALALNRLRLFYQPVRAVSDQHIAHYEVLARLLDENGILVLPEVFVGQAERAGLMPAVDRWVVARSLAVLAELQAWGRPVSLAINLSAASLEDTTMAGEVQQRIHTSGVSATSITFEVTETAAIHDLDRAASFIRKLRAVGCRFALDDFGTGFSSLAYLKHLPVDTLKIDGAFVRDVVRNATDRALLQAVVQVARALGKTTIAEGVERLQQLSVLAALGIDYAQGYRLGCPRPDIAALTA